jgi:multicomponent Na+:H+ antiporter subunit B
MITAFGFVLLTLLVVTAVAIVVTPNLFVAVMLMSIFSLLMAATFFLLDAADVALTEAAIGAGMSTILFLGALALIGEREARQADHRLWLPLAVIALTAFTVIYATFDKPRLGDPAAPVHQHVAPWYLEQTPVLMEMSNVVTAVLAGFRAYDTLGEVLVIFTAGLGVMLILASGRPDQSRRGRAGAGGGGGLRHHLIPRVVGQLLIPFIVLFGLYLQFHGEFGPGGGFQAGAIIAVGIVLHALLEGEAAGRAILPTPVLVGLMAGGALLFCAVGFAGMLLGGNFLDYAVLAASPVAGQQLGIHLVEAGVGITVTGTLVAAFHAFADRESAA